MRHLTYFLRGVVCGAVVSVLPLALSSDPAHASDVACVLARGNDATLGEVRFTNPSGWLSQETLAAISAAHAPCTREVPSVEAVIEAVNAAFAAVGADLAFADFAGLSGQTVLIDLVEVRYGNVRVEGAETTDPDYLRARVGIREGDLVDLRRVEARVSAIAELDGLDVAADLQPGQARGTSDVVLQVTEPPAVVRTFGIDTLGAADTGRIRASGAVRIASLTGLRDPLTLSFAISKGTRQVGLDYSRPIGTEGLRLSFGLSIERSRAINAPPPGNGLETQGIVATVGLSLPLQVSDERLSLVTASVSAARDSSDLAGVKINDLQTVELAFGSTHQWRFAGRGVVGFSQTLRIGRVADGVLGGSDTYLRHDGTAFGLLRLSQDWTLGSELRWQVADGPLPAFARFSAVGRTGVRGYAAASGSDDAGWLSRLELRRAQIARGSWLLSPFVFADIGRGASHAGGSLVWGALRSSVGLGLDLDFQRGRDPSAGAAQRFGAGAVASLLVAMPLHDALPHVRKRQPILTFNMTTRF